MQLNEMWYIMWYLWNILVATIVVQNFCENLRNLLQALRMQVTANTNYYADL